VAAMIHCVQSQILRHPATTSECAHTCVTCSYENLDAYLFRGANCIPCRVSRVAKLGNMNSDRAFYWRAYRA
jgi:hypothetical protein